MALLYCQKVMKFFVFLSFFLLAKQDLISSNRLLNNIESHKRGSWRKVLALYVPQLFGKMEAGISGALFQELKNQFQINFKSSQRKSRRFRHYKQVMSKIKQSVLLKIEIKGWSIIKRPGLINNDFLYCISYTPCFIIGCRKFLLETIEQF